MPSCDLKIVLDRPDRTYRPGEIITGAVEVHVNERCECQSLILTRVWRTHGKGNVTSGGVKTINLFKGTWQPGESFAYEFRLEVSGAAYTYHGTYLNIDWYLRVQADIPWAIDPKADTEYFVVPGSVSNPAPEPVVEVKIPGGPLAIGCSVFFGLLLLGGGVLMIGTVVMDRSRECGSLFLAGGGLVLGSVGIGIMYAGVRKVLAERRLGRVTVELDRGVLVAGGQMTARLKFTPRQSLVLTEASATLLCTERCTSGSGTNRTTHEHNVFSKRVTLAAGRSLTAGEHIDACADLTLPRDAPLSIDVSDNTLEWVVRFAIATAGLPEVTKEVTLRVIP